MEDRSPNPVLLVSLLEATTGMRDTGGQCNNEGRDRSHAAEGPKLQVYWQTPRS